MADSADSRLMQRALELAANGRGMTYPNPMVGALLVKHGRIVGEGYHRRVGGDHAEIAALKAAGSRANGATLYVTLEPCCHTGRTGPCTEALIKAGIKEVVLASSDPDPRVNGKGAKILRKHKINVRSGVLKAESIALNEAYFHYHRTGLPFVILKMAQSLDGRIATSTGDSKWISSKSARAYAHRLRSEVGAVVVGGETARTDDPALTVRLVKGQSPYRIIFSHSLKLPSRLKLLAENSDRKTILASSEESVKRFMTKSNHPDLIYWSIDQSKVGTLDLNDFLRKAGAFGLRSLLIEGGSRLATAFLKQHLVDKYVAILAPKVVGRGIEAIGDLGIEQIDQAIQFDRSRFIPCGGDLVFEGYPRGKS